MVFHSDHQRHRRSASPPDRGDDQEADAWHQAQERWQERRARQKTGQGSLQALLLGGPARRISVSPCAGLARAAARGTAAGAGSNRCRTEGTVARARSVGPQYASVITAPGDVRTTQPGNSRDENSRAQRGPRNVDHSFEQNEEQKESPGAAAPMARQIIEQYAEFANSDFVFSARWNDRQRLQRSKAEARWLDEAERGSRGRFTIYGELAITGMAALGTRRTFARPWTNY